MFRWLAVLTVSSLFVSSLAVAQPLKKRIEKAKDRQDLRQDNRQLADDRLDAVRAEALLRDYDAAAAANDAAKLAFLDGAFNRHLVREIAESKVESAQARKEIREDRREVAGDKKETVKDVVVGAGPGAVARDVKDTKRDQVNLADDQRDAVRERLSRERLEAIQAQLGGLAGRFDAPSVAQKRTLYAEVVGNAVRELGRDKEERREDRRELREDKKP